jgi:hypothetical protein
LSAPRRSTRAAGGQTAVETAKFIYVELNKSLPGHAGRKPGRNVRLLGPYGATGIGPTNIAAFSEVKARSGDGYGDPREAVGPEKVRRLRRAAEIWLARNPELLELEIGFEVVGVRGKRIERAPL